MDWPTLIHVIGGAFGLLFGAAAIVVRKGSERHQLAGQLFVLAMVVMAVPGGLIAYGIGKPFDALSSGLAIYLVVTGGVTFRILTFAQGLLLSAMGTTCLLGYLAVELYAAQTGVRATDAPTGAGYVFATVLALALFGDVKHLRQRLDARALRVRHLWRMNFGLLTATASFFGARPHLFPEWMQTYGLLLALTFAPLAVMVYWRFRYRRRGVSGMAPQ